MAKIKGWQVLAIGNSRTPKDWKLKGMIFLAFNSQLKLVVEFELAGFATIDSSQEFPCQV